MAPPRDKCNSITSDSKVKTEREEKKKGDRTNKYKREHTKMETA